MCGRMSTPAYVQCIVTYTTPRHYDGVSKCGVLSVPHDHVCRCVQVIVKLEDKITLYCKGAGEFVLSVCTPYIHNYSLHVGRFCWMCPSVQSSHLSCTPLSPDAVVLARLSEESGRELKRHTLEQLAVGIL